MLKTETTFTKASKTYIAIKRKKERKKEIKIKISILIKICQNYWLAWAEWTPLRTGRERLRQCKGNFLHQIHTKEKEGILILFS